MSRNKKTKTKLFIYDETKNPQPQNSKQLFKGLKQITMKNKKLI